MYSRGQTKSTSGISWQPMNFLAIWFQILVPLGEMCRKTHLRSFSHDPFRSAIFLTQINDNLNWVHDGIQVHHGTLGNCVMALLLAHCPCGRFSGQWNSVSIHKSPGMVDELVDDINWAWVECGECCLLRIVESLLLNLAISVLYPPPVLDTKILV